MRIDIGYPGRERLAYEIRGILDAAGEISRLGVPMVWENIGDPVMKGEDMPVWMREIVGRAAKDAREAAAYTPTLGHMPAREFVAARARAAGRDLSADRVIFFNGLGDAIGKLYAYLHPHARIAGPSPSYPAHASAESARTESVHPTYDLIPERGWLPDTDGLRALVKERRDIAGILIVNPGNPTGRVIPRAALAEIADIARANNLFIISDEIYGGIAFGAEPFVSMADIAPDVPMLVMRGISKEWPWPGGRCGWVEVYNAPNDSAFAEYVRTVIAGKTLEVCAGSLPQFVLAEVMSDARYEPHLAARRAAYARKAEIAERAFRDVPGVIAPRSDGAFYMSVVFTDTAALAGGSLPISNPVLARRTEELSRGMSPDKRFVYHLMAHAGVCVVPLSGMHSPRVGFRMTLLEPDEKKFEILVKRIARTAQDYLSNGGAVRA